MIKLIIEEICKMMEEYQVSQVDHIYYEGYDVADELAKFGHNVTRLTEWEDINLIPSST